jgi:acetyl esterase/lipase
MITQHSTPVRHPARVRVPRRSRLLLALLSSLSLVACDVPDPAPAERVPSRRAPAVSAVYRYGPLPGQDLLLYKPQNWRSSQRRPVVVYAHGGAWVAGTAQDLDPMVLELLAAGAVVVSVEYRLAQPAAVQVGDLLSAASWVSSNATKLGAHPARIFLAGHSAGGHLALLAGLSGPTNGAPRPTSGFKGVFVAAAPTALDVPEFDPVIMGVRVHDVLASVNACPSSPCPHSVLSSLSPLRHVDAGDPPVYYIAGDLDPVVPVSQGRALAETYRAQGMDHRFWFDVVENAEHQPGLGANAAALRRFLEAPPA